MPGTFRRISLHSRSAVPAADDAASPSGIDFSVLQGRHGASGGDGSFAALRKKENFDFRLQIVGNAIVFFAVVLRRKAATLQSACHERQEIDDA
jgi:hypothetical protein